MKMAEYKKLLASIRETRFHGQIHLTQRDGRGICGRRAPESRITDDINVMTCLNCQTKRLQPESINEILRNKGKFRKELV
jgi:hypothetical protein